MDAGEPSGVLLGLACGDALGRPVEFRSSDRITAEHGRVTEMLGHGTHGQPAGTITDDTEMALCIARSLADRSEFHPEDIAARFVEWSESGPFDVGIMTSRSLRRIGEGESWDRAGMAVWEASAEGSNAGNGSLMRCAPYGIAFGHDRDRLQEVSRTSSRITHADPRCQHGCAALNLVLSSLLEDRENPVGRARIGLDADAPSEVVEVLERVPDGVAENDLSNSGYVIHTVEAGLYHGLTADSAEEAIVGAVMMGGDTDTIAAVTGAVAGARFGMAGLPERWLVEIDEPVRAAFRSIENIDVTDLSPPESAVTFEPTLTITAEVDAVFETTVGVIHRIDSRDTFTIKADRGRPEVLDEDVVRLIRENTHATTELDEERFEAQFDAVRVKRYGQTETEYKEWAVERLQRAHTTTVHYTGDNNVDYSRECEPNLSDISVQHITPVYLPRVRQTTHLREYEYPLEYFAAGPSRVTVEDGIRRCVQCGTTDDDTYTYCENCGSVNCPSHTKTERWEDEPICTGCAVTERFAFKTKYFYDEENLEAFRDEYEAMPIHEKAMENPPLVAGSVLVTVVALIGILVTTGIV